MKWNLVKESAPLKNTWIVVTDGKRVGVHYNEDGFPQNNKESYETTNGATGICVHASEITHWGYLNGIKVPFDIDCAKEKRNEADFKWLVLVVLMSGNIIASVITIAMLMVALFTGTST